MQKLFKTLLIILLTLYCGISQAHNVNSYTGTCGVGPTYSIQPNVSLVNNNSNYSWKYKNQVNAWICITNGVNIINGNIYNITGATYIGTTNPGPIVFTNPNGLLQGLRLRCFISDNANPCNQPPGNSWTSNNDFVISINGTPCSCDNVNDPGTIGYNESICGDSLDPAEITNLSLPTGGTGSIQYQWFESNDSGLTSTLVSGANNQSYDPGTITQSKWYRRMSKRSNCSDYLGTTWIEKRIDTIPNIIVSGNTEMCKGNQTTISASGGTSYQWSTGDSVSTVSLGEGTYTITVSDGYCSSTSYVVVSEISGTIGNYVWNDLNLDGIQNEPTDYGMSFVRVELWDAGMDTSNSIDDSLLETTFTGYKDLNPGYYQFTVCNSGNYFLKFPSIISGNKMPTYSDNTPVTNLNSDIDSSGKSPIFYIDVYGSGTDKDNLTIDAGYIDFVPLPVSDITASVVLENNISTVRWSTTNEKNTDLFEIQRSIDSKVYYTIGSIKASGNTNGKTNYQISDNVSNFNDEVIYYKVKVIDIDKNFYFSNVVDTKLTKDISENLVYPSPFTDHVNVLYNIETEGEVSINITDINGRVISSKIVGVSAGENIIKVDNMNKLPNGLYFVKITDIQSNIKSHFKISK